MILTIRLYPQVIPSQVTTFENDSNTHFTIMIIILILQNLEMSLKSSIIATILAAIALNVSGCQSPSISEKNNNQTKTKVVATDSILCDLVSRIAQETISLTCLIKPGTDPHTYNPTPRDRTAIEQAQLIFYGGYNLEPKIDKLIAASNNPAPKIPVYEQAVPKPIFSDSHEHDHESDQDHDNSETKSNPDPHVWQDALNGVKIVTVITQQLAKIEPKNQQQYQQNLTTISNQLIEIHSQIKQQIATIPIQQRHLITNHNAFAYYSNAYQINVIAIQGISTESKPSAARIKEIVETIKKTGVKTIFIEQNINPAIMNTIANEAKVKISPQPLFTSGIGDINSRAATYEQMLLFNTETIVQGLTTQ